MQQVRHGGHALRLVLPGPPWPDRGALLHGLGVEAPTITMVHAGSQSVSLLTKIQRVVWWTDLEYLRVDETEVTGCCGNDFLVNLEHGTLLVHN